MVMDEIHVLTFHLVCVIVDNEDSSGEHHLYEFHRPENFIKKFYHKCDIFFAEVKVIKHYMTYRVG